MDTLHPEAALLIGYVDKQLSPEDVIRAQDLIERDPKALAFVETLTKSQLPYSESFEFLLENQKESVSPGLDSKISTRSWQWPVSLAASLLLGLAIGFGMFANKSVSNKNMTYNWITEVANYQLLYVRETVTPAPILSDEQKLALQDKLSKPLNFDLKIPDLKEQSLSFRRGQLLEIEGKPLVQLAYLPNDGLPVALCILRDDADDSLPRSGESRGLSYVEWSKGGLSYVLIGKTDIKILESAALSSMNQI